MTFLLGFLAGGFVGFFTMACIAAGSRNDHEVERVGRWMELRRHQRP